MSSSSRSPWARAKAIVFNASGLRMLTIPCDYLLLPKNVEAHSATCYKRLNS